MGRLFEKKDYDPGIADFVVLSDGFWRRRFGADPNVIGKPLRIDDDLCTILGVLPPGFRHPGRRDRNRGRGLGPVGLARPSLPGTQPPRLFPSGRARAAEARRHAGGGAGAPRRPRRGAAPRVPGSDYPENDGWAPRLVPAPGRPRRRRPPRADGAARGRGPRSPDRVRERREPPARARLGPAARDRRPPGARRVARAPRPPAADREPRRRAAGRRPRTPPRRVRRGSPDAALAGEHPPASRGAASTAPCCSLPSAPPS